jgi:hypothetical protein
MFGKNRLFRLYERGAAGARIVGQWEQHNVVGLKRGAIDQINRREFWFRIFCISLCVMALDLLLFSAGLIPVEVAGGVLVFGLAVMFAGLRLAFGAGFDQVLIKDLEELERRNTSDARCGNMSTVELMKMAEETLVDLARSIVCLQDAAGVHGSLDSCWVRAEKIREGEFKPLHGLFLRFGLVGEKWNSFFDEARRRQKAAVAKSAT